MVNLNKLGILVIAALLGCVCVIGQSETASAAKYRKTTPVAIRGTWVSHRDSDGYSTSLKITKRTLKNTNYRYGKREYKSSAISTSGNKYGARLTVPIKKTRSGYWNLGSNAGAYWYVKPTKINYKGHKVKVLKRILFGLGHIPGGGYDPNKVTYLYKK